TRRDKDDYAVFHSPLMTIALEPLKTPPQELQEEEPAVKIDGDGSTSKSDSKEKSKVAQQAKGSEPVKTGIDKNRFGRRVVFSLANSYVEAPMIEYAIHWPTFVQCAGKFQLELISTLSFEQCYQRY